MTSLESDVCFDYIIHAVSNAGPNFFANSPVEAIMSNIDGVAHLLDYGLERVMKCFLYISSREVYG
jgi:nucleoside-diphosphate-sugar epimerase